MRSSTLYFPVRLTTCPEMKLVTTSPRVSGMIVKPAALAETPTTMTM